MNVTHDESEPMMNDDPETTTRITLAEPVSSTDGPFGELGDIVVDPQTRTVTHLIVEPHHRHHQARLVPMSLVDVGSDQLTVRLDDQQLRSLQRVAGSDYVEIHEPIELGDEWDVGVEHMVALPYAIDESGAMAMGSLGLGMGGMGMGADGTMAGADHVTIEYDRIPRGDCEIRHESDVMSSDDHLVGLVAGMSIDGDHVEGVITQTGFIGFRHRVVVPIAAVAGVRSDHITCRWIGQHFVDSHLSTKPPTRTRRRSPRSNIASPAR